MAKDTAVAGNPTQEEKGFDPSKASIDDLRSALAEPTQVDRELTGDDSQEPELEEQAPANREQQKPADFDHPAKAEETEEEEESEDSEEEETPEQEVEATTEEEEDEESEETEEDRLKKMRLRPRDKLDQQVMDLYKSEGFEGTFQDAVDKIYGRRQSPPEQEDRGESPEDPFAEDRQRAATLREEVASLEKELDEASDDLDTPKALKLQRELFRKEKEADKIESRIEAHEREQQRAVEGTRRQQTVESRERAVERYPSLNDKDSIERKRFDAFLQDAQSDPTMAPIFQSPLWPELMADRFANVIGLSPSQGKPAPKARESAPRPPARKQAPSKVRQLTSGQRQGPSETQPTAESLRRDVPKMSRDNLFELLGQPKK